MMKSPASIRARMTLAFALAVVVLLLPACLLLTGYARRMALASAATTLQSARAKVEHELPAALRSFDLNRDRAELSEAEDDIAQERVALLLLDHQGQIIEASRNATPFRRSLVWRTSHADEERDWRTLSVRMENTTLVLGLPWTDTQRGLDNQALTLGLLSLFMGGAASVGAWFLVGRTLSPIGRLSQQAREAGADGSRLQLQPPSQDAEVVELVSTLNDLLTRQSRANEARGRFYAAASHELRTPLQALSGHLELALLRERTRDEYQAVVVEANTQTQRLTSLVRDLLRLHQLEGGTRMAQEPVDMEQTCRRVLQSLAPLIAARGRVVQTEITPGVFVASAPAHADMIARNLIENAVQHAAPNGPIHVSLRQDEKGVRLEVRNPVDGPADRSPEQWFEAFYRPDASRTARTGGNGLGLALCKAIAAANGWHISLRHEGADVVAIVVFTLETGKVSSCV